ncbi:MAG: hypothetical protein Fur0012_12440 [Elusimicrobiota bacterium]
MFFPTFALLALSSIFSYSGEIQLRTSDGCLLSAYENTVSTENPVILEIHGLGSDRKEWDRLNHFLEKERINYLAIDLRGHGKSISCKGEKADYRNFSEKDWGKITLDWEAGLKHLLKKFPRRLIIPAGASIGANSAIIFSRDKKFSGLILLSPGYNYAGLRPSEALAEIRSSMLFSYSPKDPYSAKSCSYFSKICFEKNLDCHFLEAESGHGVQIFKSSLGDDYASVIVKFIKALYTSK